MTTIAQQDRTVDFAATKSPAIAMREALRRFVYGYRGPRERPVTTAQIRKHFAATSWGFVHEALLRMIADGSLVCVCSGLSRKKAGGVYALAELTN